jgi:asparagine synthase (glutamine-hydrolysing)
VAMLKRLGVDDVICFSYGQKGNYEAEISKKVADALGYQWYFVEYTHRKWYQCYHSDEASAFEQYAGNLSSLPHFQDFLAVQELQKEGKIPKKSVFVPGHCGNLIAVYCLPRKILEISPDFDHFVTYYWKEHYSLWPWNEQEIGEELKNIFRKKIQKSVGNIDIHDPKSVANAIEFFNGYERQAKFIVNSVRVYEFFGYIWRIPIVDRELIDFFLKVPLQYRMRDDKSYLYMQYAKNVLFIDDLKKLQDIDCTTKIAYNLAYLYKKKCEETINDNKILEILWFKIYYFKKKLLAYDSNPYFGMIQKEKFLKLYSGKQTINSFLALDYLEKFIPSPFDLLKINNAAKIFLDFGGHIVNPSNYRDKESPQRSIVSIKCRDLVMDCSFEAKGTTEREIIRHLIEHTESAYNIPVLTADVLFRIKKGIKKY